MHVCVQSRLHFQPRCLQVCPARRCCIPAWTTDRDFHSRRPADGVYMCQPLQQITNPPQQKQNFPLSFCNFQEEEEAVGHSRQPRDTGRNPLSRHDRSLKTIAPEKLLAVVSYEGEPGAFHYVWDKYKIEDVYQRILLLLWIHCSTYNLFNLVFSLGNIF